MNFVNISERKKAGKTCGFHCMFVSYLDVTKCSWVIKISIPCHKKYHGLYAVVFSARLHTKKKPSYLWDVAYVVAVETPLTLWSPHLSLLLCREL